MGSRIPIVAPVVLSFPPCFDLSAARSQAVNPKRLLIVDFMDKTPTKSSLPTKLKRGKKPTSKRSDDRRRLCSVVFGKASFENIFKPTKQEKSSASVDTSVSAALASIGLSLNSDPQLSDRVCQPCARKVRRGTELFSFLRCAVEGEIESLQTNADVDRSKRQLPTTITCDSSITTNPNF